MRGHKIEIAPERIAECRHLYELTSTPVPDIAAMIGISRRTLDRRIVEWGWTPRHAPRHATDRALVAAPPSQSPVSADAASAPANESDLRKANALRIQQLVATTLAAVEGVLAKVGPADEGGAERSGRTLAAVARTLQEMSAIAQPDDETPPDDADHDDDFGPRDIDEFRQELARRIRGIVEARRARVSGRADGLPADPQGS